MAFPTVASRHGTNITSASSSHTVNLSSSAAEGDLYVGVLRGAAPSLPTSINFPSGWNMLKSGTQTGTSNDAFRVFYKRLQAGDAEIGASSMTVTTTGGSVKAAYHIVRITGSHASSAPEASSDATGASTTPNPNSLSPSWGAEDTLWLWVGCWEGEQTSPPSGNPTNYSNGGGANSGTAGAVDTNVRVATSERQLNASSEDPGSWTISVSDDWIAWTVAVRPAGGTAHSLAGVANGAATSTGAIALGFDLAGTAAGAGTSTGAIKLALVLAGQANGVATSAGDLDVTTGGTSHLLAGAADGVGSSTGNLVLSFDLAGAADGTSTSTGALALSFDLAGQANGVSTAAGALKLALVLAGVSAGVGSSTGNMTNEWILAGVSDGTSSATGTLLVVTADGGQFTGDFPLPIIYLLRRRK